MREAGGASKLAATTVFVYDPANNQWLSQLPDFDTGRAENVAWMVGVGNGRKLCVAGGGVDCFGLTQEQCTAKGSTTQCLPINAAAWNAENADLGPVPFNALAAGYAKKTNCEGGEELWRVGGWNCGLGGCSSVALSSYFDVRTGSWRVGPDLASGSADYTEAVVLDNELYKTGGLDYSAPPNSPAACDKLVRCSSCFSWPMFMPAIIGERMK